MGKTKRTRNLQKNVRTMELKAELKNDPNRVVAYIPQTYVSRKEAFRTFKLTENDLDVLNHRAVLGEKRGQEGIFYPVGDLRMLALDKKEQSRIDEKMIPESILARQIPKSYFDLDYLNRLRDYGVKGTRSGHKGRSTYFYTKEVIETELGFQVITSDLIEGKDYIKEKSVPVEITANLEVPPVCIWSGGSAGMIERCFLLPDVATILSSILFVSGPRRPRRMKDRVPDVVALEAELEPELGQDHNPGLGQDHDPGLGHDPELEHQPELEEDHHQELEQNHPQELEQNIQPELEQDHHPGLELDHPDKELEPTCVQS